MERYKPNSYRSKEAEQKEAPPEKLEKVVTGSVKSRKKGPLNKIVETFMTKDISDVKSYLLHEVFVPTVKNAIWSLFSNGLHMSLFGEPEDRKPGTASNQVQYGNRYDYRNRRDQTRSRVRAGTNYSYDDIIFDNRGDAEEVLSRMDEMIEEYGTVSVANLYDLAGITCQYTDYKYGWTNTNSAVAVRVSDGYILKLPRAVPLD